MACPSRIVVQVDLPPSLGGRRIFEGGLREAAVDLRMLDILEARFHPGGRDVPLTFARWTNGACIFEVGRHRVVFVVEQGSALGGREGTVP